MADKRINCLHISGIHGYTFPKSVTRLCYILCISVSLQFFSVALRASNIEAVTPNITVRLTNPQYNCVTNEYCLDVEFQSDLPDQVLFGMNVRFFYEDQVLEFVNFRDFQGGYGPVAPNPPQVLTSPAAFGYNYFGFGTPGNGPADWVNGAIQLTNESLPPIYISSTEWTKLYQVCFTIDNPGAYDANFCPPVVWDLEQDPANGGYLAGDDGVVLTVVSAIPGESAPSMEHVAQFNWDYSGSGSAPPYGGPMQTTCILLMPDATIDASTMPGCYYEDRVFQPMFPEMQGATYLWNFGDGAIPATAIGYGPHTVYYDTMGTKTVSLVIYPAQGGALCGDSSSIEFSITNCPANIVGHINSIMNIPIPGVNVRLYADTNTDGLADNSTLIRSVFSNSQGDYSMASLIPGNYVIVETQPSGWYTIDDGDSTPDNDIVDNIDPLDNLIPVTLAPGEIDLVNYFIEGASPGMISGTVFIDLDGDQTPDANEGLTEVSVSLFADANSDGVADSNDPVATLLTSASGSFTFQNIPVGNYVLVESQPEDYNSASDFDPSNDGDEVPNTNMQNDTIPITIINGETDADNYFIDVEICSRIVTNTNDAGPGSLRDALGCAINGDTILFSSSLAGLSITINSGRILIEKNIFIHSSCVPRIIITSSIAGLFDIAIGATVEFKQLNITSGYSGNLGAAFNNQGTLKLQDVNVLRNPLLPPGENLIRNATNAQLIINGNCWLETD